MCCPIRHSERIVDTIVRHHDIEADDGIGESFCGGGVDSIMVHAGTAIGYLSKVGLAQLFTSCVNLPQSLHDRSLHRLGPLQARAQKIEGKPSTHETRDNQLFPNNRELDI